MTTELGKDLGTVAATISPLPEWMKPSQHSNWDQYEDEPEPTSKISKYSFYKGSAEGEVTLYYDDAAHAYYRFGLDGKRVDIPGVTSVLQIIDKSKPLMLWAVKLAITTIKNGLFASDGSMVAISTEEILYLLDDAKDKHNQELREAGDVGHVVHNLLEDAIKTAIKYNNGVLQPIITLPTDDRVKNSVAAAYDWADNHKVRFIFTERKVYSRKYDVAGTGDGLAWVTSCDNPACCREQYVDRLSWVDWKTSKGMRTSYILQCAIYRYAYTEETGENVPDTWILKLDKETGKLTPCHRGPSTFTMELNAFLHALYLYRSMDEVEESLKSDRAQLKVIAQGQRKEAKAKTLANKRLVKAEAKVASKAETKCHLEDAKAHYKALRAKGVSVTDAKLLAYPNVTKRGKRKGTVEPLPELLSEFIVESIIEQEFEQESGQDVGLASDYEWIFKL